MNRKLYYQYIAGPKSISLFGATKHVDDKD